MSDSSNAPLPGAGDHPGGPDAWVDILFEAFEDQRRNEAFLPLAEDAVRACPGDAVILCMAATAALLDERPDRALVFLKRLSKRFVPTSTDFLLQALALAQQNKLGQARAVLERHGLNQWHEAMRAFPGGWLRREWLADRLDVIMGRKRPKGRQQAKVLGSKAGGKRSAKPSEQQRGVAKPSRSERKAAPSGLPLPDIDIPFEAEIDLAPLLAAAASPSRSDGHWYRLRERLSHLSLAQGFDELLCLSHLHGVESLAHQIETVRKVLKRFRGRVLLADEVGLGKTIEAGMVLKEYVLRGMAERVLVLVPASLVGQWREELEEKFDIPFASTHDPLLRDDPERFWRQPRLIASLAVARRSDHARRLVAQAFDLVIVDEAHHLRDRSSKSYKLVDKLNKRFLLLLSATPVQNDLTELYNLLTLLKPGIFKTLKEFRSVYMTPGKPRRPANPEGLRVLMRDAMIRNTRAAVALQLPRRHATTIRVAGQEEEREAYHKLADLARRLAADGSPGWHRMALHHLLAAAGSSPAAAAAAVGRIAARHADEPAWRALADQWAAVGAGGKVVALLDLLRRNPKEKTLVFVRYRETLGSLAELLKKSEIGFSVFHGSLSGPDKDAAITSFREKVPVLLSTETGGEGRNIQFCNTLVNFDVPWNPMAIEQRIGRIDRIGQAREVFVFNLVSRGTLEERVLDLLEEKISMFELVVGEVGAILGGLEEERDFAELVLEAWMETTEVGRSEAFVGIGQRLDAARRQHEEAEALDHELFGEDFEAT